MVSLNIYLSIILFASSLISIFIALYSMQQKDVPAAKWFACLCIASTIYSFGYAMELLNSDFHILIGWNFIQYIGVEFIAVFWLLVAFEYCGMDKLLSPWVKTILFAIPIINLLILSTNSYHHLFYKDMYLTTNGFFPVLAIVKGPYYFINSFYIVSSVLCSNIFYLKIVTQGKGQFQYQSAIMFIASLLPLIAHFMLVFNLIPLDIDYAPFFLTISFLLVLIGLFKYKFLNLVPLAQEKVFESIKDGVIVLDHDFLILNFNPAAADIFNELNRSSIGKSLEIVLGRHTKLLSHVYKGKDTQYVKTEMPYHQYFSVKIAVLYSKFNNVAGYIITLNDITKQIEHMNQLQKMATIDNLTGIYNRGSFIEACEQELAKARRFQWSIALIMFDLDQFKKINDCFGHQAGDTLLKEVVNICKSSVRSGDILGRFGGEEFMVFLPKTTFVEAVEISERIRKNIENLIVIYDGNQLNVTASFGITGMPETNEENPDSLIKYADEALYLAKNSGRNCIKIVPVYKDT